MAAPDERGFMHQAVRVIITTGNSRSGPQVTINVASDATPEVVRRAGDLALAEYRRLMGELDGEPDNQGDEF